MPAQNQSYDWPNPWRRRRSLDALTQAAPGLALLTRAAFSSGLVPVITIDGAIATSSVRVSNIRIDQELGQPDRCSFVIDVLAPNVAPAGGDEILIGLGTVTLADRIFAGNLLHVRQRYEGKPDNRVWDCDAVDYTWLLNKRHPFGVYSGSATTVVRALLADYSGVITGSHVAADLATVTFTFDGSEEFSVCLDKIAKAVNGHWYIDYGKDLHFFLTEVSELPDDLDGSGRTLKLMPAVMSDDDLSQVRTRVFVQGASSRILAPIAVGETIIPVENVSLFEATGGSAINNGQVVTYTSRTQVTPLTAPTPAAAVGTDLSAGVYQYAYTYVTASGETVPSPIGTVTTGDLTPPSVPSGGLVNATAGIEDGVHLYAVSFVTAAGESVPGSTTPVTTGAGVIPAMDIPSYGHTTGAGGSLFQNYTYYYAATIVAGAGETTISNGFETVSTGPGQHSINVGIVGSGYIGVTARNLYRWDGVSNWRFLATLSGATSSSYTDTGGVALGANAPTSNTTSTPYNNVSVGFVQGPTGVTQRKLYRTAAAGAQLKLLTTIANNTATSYTDSTADGSLGANAPTSSTAFQKRVSLSDVTVGSTGVTSRKVYRTVVGGAQLKLVATIADNTTTIYTDTTADGSLGANAPTNDSSALYVFGLSTTSGATAVGATTINVADATSFRAGGGWALIGTSGVNVRYTGKTATSLTGIPASGNGSVQAAIPSATLIQGCAALTGVPASGTGSVVRALNLGDDLSIFVQRDDTAAQADLGSREGGDGVHDLLLRDTTLTSAAQCAARGDADLVIYSSPLTTLHYTTQDLKTRPGKSITVDLAAPTDVSGTFTIQSVTIERLDPRGITAPLYTVVAGRAHLTFMKILQQFKVKGL